MEHLSFTVLGVPSPQGNKTGFVRGGRVVLVEGRRPKSRAAFHAWRETVASEARTAMAETPSFGGPVNVNVTFRMPRPKIHYRTGRYAGQLKPAAPTWITSAPDIDKLCRSILDSLTTARVWNDDSQVATLHARKVYATPNSPSGVDITVTPLPEGDPACR